MAHTPDFLLAASMRRMPHETLSISFSDPKLAYRPGELVEGNVLVDLKGQTIDYVHVFLVGTSEVAFTPDYHHHPDPSAEFPSERITTRSQLCQIKHILVLHTLGNRYGCCSFKLRIPRFTDTDSAWRSSLIPKEFAVTRHRLPPTCNQQSGYSSAKIKYMVVAQVPHTSPHLPLHRATEEIILNDGTSQDHPQQERFLKPVLRCLHRSRASHTSSLCLRLLCEKLLFNSLATGCHLRLTPSIFLPALLISGHHMRVTLAFKTEPRSWRDPYAPVIHLHYLRIVLKEETSILLRPSKVSMFQKLTGQHCRSAQTRATQYEIAESEFAKSLRLQGSPPVLHKLYPLDRDVLPDITSFIISRSHSISVQLRFTCHGQYIDSKQTLPIRVLQRHWEEDQVYSARSSRTPSRRPSRTSLRHLLAVEAAEEFMAKARLPRVREYSEDSMGIPVRTTPINFENNENLNPPPRGLWSAPGVLQLSASLQHPAHLRGT